MANEIKLPVGWRRLRVGEIRKDGDQFWQVTNRWELSALAGYAVTANDPILIRAIKNDVAEPPLKKKKLAIFNQFSLVPSRFFGSQKSTADKVKDYLAKVKKNELKK